MKSQLVRFSALLLAGHFFCSPLAAESKRLLLLGQKPDGHPPGTHEYMRGMHVIERCLSGVPDLDIVTVSADEPWSEGPQLLSKVDGVVIFLSEGARWASKDPARLQALRDLAARGGGFVGLHWGIGTRRADNIQAYVELVGGCHGGPDRRYKVVTTDLKIPGPKHPIMRGVHTTAPFQEEFYYKLKFPKPTNHNSLLTARIEGADETVAWNWVRPDGGRSFGFTGLHFHANWQLESVRRMVAQGILWTLQLPIPEPGLNVDVSENDLLPLAECGHGISIDLALQGWISLFDGETATGWNGAEIRGESLMGGSTKYRIPPCAMEVQVQQAGEISIGSKTISLGKGNQSLASETGGRVKLKATVGSIRIRPSGLASLFEGKNLKGWREVSRPGSKPTDVWQLSERRLIARGGPAALEYSAEIFGDMIVQLLAQTNADHSNGGLFFRSIAGDFMNGYEAQIHNRAIGGNPAKPSRYATGGIDDRQNARKLISRDHEPFLLTVIADKDQLATWVNGYQVADWRDNRPIHENPRKGKRLQPGVIQLQAHDPETDLEIHSLRAGALGQESAKPARAVSLPPS